MSLKATTSKIAVKIDSRFPSQVFMIWSEDLPETFKKKIPMNKYVAAVSVSFSPSKLFCTLGSYSKAY